MATSSEILPVAQRAAVGVYEAEGYTVTGYGPSDVELTHDDGHELLVDELGCAYAADPLAHTAVLDCDEGGYERDWR